MVLLRIGSLLLQVIGKVELWGLEDNVVVSAGSEGGGDSVDTRGSCHSHSGGLGNHGLDWPSPDWGRSWGWGSRS